MATINGLYVFVEDENLSYGVEVTEHTVEKGIAISDHVKPRAIRLSLKGEIVGKNAASVLAKLRTMHQGGTLCKYVGRVTLGSCLIEELNTTQTHSIWGGYAFNITLKEVRTASTSYTPPKKTSSSTSSGGTKQVTKKSKSTAVYHTVKKGDCVWNLVAKKNAPYKSLSRPAINGKNYSACDWVMQKNQSAFSKKGDFRTLQIKKKLLVGYR